MQATMDDLENVFRYAEGLEKRLAALENKPQSSDLEQIKRDLKYLREQISDVRASLPQSGFTAPVFIVRFLTFGGYALLWSGAWFAISAIARAFFPFLYVSWPVVLIVIAIGVLVVCFGKPFADAIDNSYAERAKRDQRW